MGLSCKYSHYTETAGAALESAGAHIVERAHDAWDFTLKNGVVLRGTACIERGWLRFACGALHRAAAQERLHYEDLADLLEKNAHLGGGVRYALSPAHAVQLIGEVVLDEDVDIPRRVREACDGLKQATALSPHGAGSPAPGSPGTGASANPLAALCREATWPYAERESGALAVELETRFGAHHGVLTETGGFTARLLLPVPARRAPSCCYAVGACLLRASRALRMVRPVVEPGGSVSFEAVFNTVPSPVELNHVLSALSVAADSCSESIQALCEEKVAVSYLESCGLTCFEA